MLRTVALLDDAWEDVHGASEETGKTCGADRNSFSEPAYPPKRIDYIMHRAGPSVKSKVVMCELPLADRVPGKEYRSGLSESKCQSESFEGAELNEPPPTIILQLFRPRGCDRDHPGAPRRGGLSRPHPRREEGAEPDAAPRVRPGGPRGHRHHQAVAELHPQGQVRVRVTRR